MGMSIDCKVVYFDGASSIHLVFYMYSDAVEIPIRSPQLLEEKRWVCQRLKLSSLRFS